MKVVALKLKDEDGHINYLKESMFDKDLGMIAEGIRREKNRQISILSEDVRSLIDQEEKNGLCLVKFYENITIADLDARTMRLGQRLQIGESLQEVTSIGKQCFDECKLFQSGEKCQLFYSVIFTKIIKSGYVKIEDETTFID